MEDSKNLEVWLDELIRNHFLSEDVNQKTGEAWGMDTYVRVDDAKRDILLKFSEVKDEGFAEGVVSYAKAHKETLENMAEEDRKRSYHEPK